MARIAVSRRTLLEAGACALAGAVVSPALALGESSGSGTRNEELVRKYYGAWEKKDLATFNALLADNFTFTSPNNDDHISKSVFKTRCWDSQAQLIDHFDLERIAAGPDDAFMRGTCHTKTGKTFRNVEYLRFKNGQIESIECYFGGSGYPSAANKAQS
jgi:ketosteroid isomerase-like protein